MLSLSRNLGIITGASVVHLDITTAPPEAVATGMRVTFAVAAMLSVVALAVAVGSRTVAAQPELGSTEVA
jgi:hypothetical protein